MEPHMSSPSPCLFEIAEGTVAIAKTQVRSFTSLQLISDGPHMSTHTPRCGGAFLEDLLDADPIDQNASETQVGQLPAPRPRSFTCCHHPESQWRQHYLGPSYSPRSPGVPTDETIPHGSKNVEWAEVAGAELGSALGRACKMGAY